MEKGAKTGQTPNFSSLEEAVLQVVSGMLELDHLTLFY